MYLILTLVETPTRTAHARPWRGTGVRVRTFCSIVSSISGGFMQLWTLEQRSFAYDCFVKRVGSRLPTEVPCHSFNYRMAAAIFIKVVSRYGKVTMRYWMKPLTAPPGVKRWS
ncbi:hypothetical protein AVEN_272155-1 [Araneus ventricosus]|uniref:Uncharacterized protein n=1 Tax=Araneus ventricosus TaxID=182803 RepID=A0A4Y2UTW4_ARAVE|nr:hypothetical protein AVEN_272155-1 [Araneus ventricosus]